MPWPPASPSCTFSTTPRAAHTFMSKPDHQNNKFMDTIFQEKKNQVKEKIVKRVNFYSLYCLLECDHRNTIITLRSKSHSTITNGLGEQLVSKIQEATCLVRELRLML